MHNLWDIFAPAPEQWEAGNRLAGNPRRVLHFHEDSKPGRKTDPERPPMTPAETMRRYRERRKGAPLRPYVKHVA